GVQSKVARELAVGGDMALANAGARDDPLVARVHQRLEIAIAENLRGKVTTGSRDARKGHATLPAAGAGTGDSACTRAISSPMRSSKPCLASFAARASAVAKARRSALPWLLTTIPRRPRSAAPL